MSVDNTGIAVDVAAGTGLSRRALAALGFSVAGVELVPAMAPRASEASVLSYVVGTAEARFFESADARAFGFFVLAEALRVV